jgi:hypothetical protein
MPLAVTPREKARDRKARQRERDRERRRIVAMAEAERLEAIAEDLAPAVMRHPVMMGGRMLIGARVQIVAGRPVRAMADPIEDRGPKSLILTETQRTAARQLQLDWHDVGTGINVAAVDYLRSGGGSGGGMGGHAALLAQCKARARLDGAMAHCGAFAPAVARVVLDCIPVSVWADEAGMTAMDGAAWISAALSRLAQFYAVTRDRKVKVGILAFGPARGSYETTLDAVNND